MTQDEIIEMARQAGLLPLLDEDCFQAMGNKNFTSTKKVIEAFAKLIAAKKREEILGLADSLGWVSIDHIKDQS